MENPYEMDDFLDRYYVLKLNQDQINHLNSHITPKEIKGFTKNYPTNKTKQNKPNKTRPGLDSLSEDDFYQIFKLLKLLYKIETEGKLPNSPYKSTFILISKPPKVQKRENFRPISLVNFNAVLNKILAN